MFRFGDQRSGAICQLGIEGHDLQTEQLQAGSRNGRGHSRIDELSNRFAHVHGTDDGLSQDSLHSLCAGLVVEQRASSAEASKTYLVTFRFLAALHDQLSREGTAGGNAGADQRLSFADRLRSRQHVKISGGKTKNDFIADLGP